jgi:hypothetical protein
MHVLDPFFGRVLTTIVVGLLLGLGYFSLDIFLSATRRNFGNVNINVAVFTRRDRASISNSLRYKSTDTNVPLRDILRNRFLFWYLIRCSFRATLAEPVLDFGPHAHAILSRIRGRAARQSASMEFKRLAGMPFIETSYWLCVVYDRSEDTRDTKSRVLRVMLIPQEVFDHFEEYLETPPYNSANWALMKKIQSAHTNKRGSFMKVDITTA